MIPLIKIKAKHSWVFSDPTQVIYSKRYISRKIYENSMTLEPHAALLVRVGAAGGWEGKEVPCPVQGAGEGAEGGRGRRGGGREGYLCNVQRGGEGEVPLSCSGEGRGASDFFPCDFKQKLHDQTRNKN